MDPGASEHHPRTLEAEATALWRARRLPPAGGVLGPPSGPAVRQLEGAWTQGDFPALVAQRAVIADVDARYLALAGRRAAGTLREVPGASASQIPALLVALGVWTGGDGRNPWDAEDRTAGVEAIVSRLAGKGVLVTRDEAFRICPTCGMLRNPERIVYEEQEGDTYLVRFPIRFQDLTVQVIVWVDSPWKLLGTTALLLNPTLRYVVAGYRRREDRELVLTSASSLQRLRSWIPDSTIEVVEEREGRAFQGTPYLYPLRHEFPMGGELTAPAGTIQCAADVGDSGTGIVPLVPGHGPTDSRIADRLGVTGWPLLNPRGKLDFTLLHKYAGLDLDTANEFVLRDLSEAGALLARLRVKRGVPYCGFCGTPLLWAPARAWCLEPSHLSPEGRALFSRLLPGETLPGQAEVAPWPVSEGNPSEEAGSIALLECSRCDRLAAPDAARQCPCGGQRTVVRRKLLRSFGAAVASWARWDPFPEGDSAHLYVNQRRRVPSLVHNLAALSGVEGAVTDVTITVAPTIGSEDVPALVTTFGADAVRSALVRTTISETGGTRFPDRCRREADRLQRWWSLAREVVSQCDASMIAAFARPIGDFTEELEVEDRAVVARWERARVLALAHYDHAASGLVHRQVSSFLDNDLIEYRELVQGRLAVPGSPPTKRAALRTLVHLLRGTSEVLAPIAPFTSESIHRSLSPERASLFEQPVAGLDRTLLNDDLSNAWNRWRTVLRSVDRLRRSLGVSRATVLPLLVLSLPADDIADRFRAEKEVLARLARVQRVEVSSSREPWAGRQRILRPVEAEIQKVYPTQASQIIHLLQRMAPRKSATAPLQEELNVVIDGYPRRVFPSMVVLVEALPERVVPVPWSPGEMYVEVPTGTARRASPPLSSDAFWLVRRLERRLRAAPPEATAPPRIAVVTAKDPLATELRSLAEPLARYLGLGELRVVEQSEELVPPTALTGRTRTGNRWWVHVPGLPAPKARQKRRLPAGRLPRVMAPPPAAESVEIDYADEKFVQREEAVRSFGQELDTIVGIPLLGPTKVAGVWQLGLHTVDDLRLAPFEAIASLPGFGGPVAEVVVSKLGGVVPSRGSRPRRGAAAPRPGARAPEQSPSMPPPMGEGPVRPAPSSIPAPPSSPQAPPVEPLPLLTKLEAPPPTPETVEALVKPPAAHPPEFRAEAPPQPVMEAPMEPPSAEPVPSDSEPVPAEPPVPAAVAIVPTSQLPELAPDEGVQKTVLLPEELPRETGTPSIPPEPLGVLPEHAEPVPEEEPPTFSPGEAPEGEAGTAPEEPPSATLPTAEPPPPPPEPETESPVDAHPAGPEPVPPSDSAPSAETLPESTSSLPPSAIPSESVEPGPVAAPPEAEQPEGRSLPPATRGPEPESSAPSAAAPPEAVEPTLEAEPAPSVEQVEGPSPAAPPSGPELEPSAPAAPTPSPASESPAPPVGEPWPPAISAAEPEPPMPPTGIELAVGESLPEALGGFLDATAAGHRGVCLVRESPERIRARVGSRPIEVYWITNLSRGPSVRPADLDAIWTLLGRKLLEDHATAFFLEGLEYLVRLHGVDAVLSGLVQFDRLARENDARIWVFLTPGLMKPTDIERFHTVFGSGKDTPDTPS